MTNPLTKQRLAEIEARCEAATDGPWTVGHRLYDDGSVMCRCDPGPCTPDEDGKIKGNLFNANYAIGNRENDNDFIVHAPTDIPALIAEVERLQKVIDMSKMCLGDIEECDSPGPCSACEYWDYPHKVKKALEQK